MEQLNAEFCIVTPCFLQGAEQSSAELRVPSIKGVLRFWWRAWSYAQFAGDIEKLKHKENQIFGSSDSKYGQSRILMRLDTGFNPRFVDGDLKEPGLKYLGYGLESRKCLWSPRGYNFNLHLIARKDKEIDEIIPALKLLGLLGGLGGRVRKGFGSLTLTKLTRNDELHWQTPTDSEKFKEELQILLKYSRDWVDEPKFSAFSRHTRIVCLNEGSAPLKILDQYGQDMLSFRKEDRFKSDRDWFHGRRTKSQFHPKRAIFGLPHNYFAPKIRNRPSKQAWVTPQKHERRASPLFFHVHSYGNGRYAGIALLMRSRFLPSGEKILLKRAGAKETVPVIPDWDILTEFLERLPKARVVWPSEER